MFNVQLVLTSTRWILLRNKICFSESCINLFGFLAWMLGGWGGWDNILLLLYLGFLLIVFSWCLIDPLGALSRLQIILPVQFTHQPWGQRILALGSLHQRYPVKHSHFLWSKGNVSLLGHSFRKTVYHNDMTRTAYKGCLCASWLLSKNLKPLVLTLWAVTGFTRNSTSTWL